MTIAFSIESFLIALKDTHFLRNTELKAILFYLRNLNKMKELVFENGYVIKYEEALSVANDYPMTIKFTISAQTVKMNEVTFTQDWPENN